jgi:hypothetical protein
MMAKTVVIKAGELVVARFVVVDHVLLTALGINNQPVVTSRPVAISEQYPLTITVEAVR